MGQSLNNLVSDIHDGHFKKIIKSLAPLVQIYELLENLSKEEKSIRVRQRKFGKIIILQVISRRLSNFKKGVW